MGVGGWRIDEGDGVGGRAKEGAEEVLLPYPAAYEIGDAEERFLAVVECDEITIAKDLGVLEGAKFGIDEPSAEDNGGRRRKTPEVLAAAEGAEETAGKRD